jgi:hypothetical protein
MKRYRMYVNGDFVASRSERWFPVYDPSTEEVIAEVPDGNAADVERGVAAACAAHVLCYAIASSNSGTPSPVPGSGLAATGLGLGQAVGAAVVSGVYQTIQYFKDHGKRPFVCLDGVQ